MVNDLLLQGRLDWERFVKELLVKVFLFFMNKDTCHTRFVETWTTSSSNHLEQVSQWEVYIATHLRVEELRALDHHKAGWEVHSPS
jgi:hypothetical protein